MLVACIKNFIGFHAYWIWLIAKIPATNSVKNKKAHTLTSDTVYTRLYVFAYTAHTVVGVWAGCCDDFVWELMYRKPHKYVNVIVFILMNVPLFTRLFRNLALTLIFICVFVCVLRVYLYFCILLFASLTVCFPLLFPLFESNAHRSFLYFGNGWSVCRILICDFGDAYIMNPME